jgi:hypothetical protein
LLDDNGDVAGNAFAIDSKEGENHPRAAWSDVAEAYLVVWGHDSNAIYGRPFDATGTGGQRIFFDRIADEAYRPVVTAAADGWLAAWVEYSAFGPGGSIYSVAFQAIDQDGKPVAHPQAASAAYTPIGRVALAGSAAQVSYLLAWSGKPLSAGEPFRIFGSSIEKSWALQTTTIQYDYDPLYRLTGAAYTDAITATFTYLYDAVGNMAAYTETIGTETATVIRKFNAANQLELAYYGPSTAEFTSDRNGNLIATSGLEDRVSYFDQRNLLVAVEDALPALWLATFVYDDDRNRMQQFLYDGHEALGVITYTNDIIGLAQVLVADDGATQTTNLFGLSLLHQDDGMEIQSLLADGLGSVRQETAGGVV